VTAIEFLFSLEQFGMKFGLESMRALCAALDHPERAFRAVHVAGTNGKGSVTAMVDAALRAAGHRSARYTSPHLVRLEERFVIDGVEVDTAALESAAARVRAAAGDLVASGALPAVPTFFECTTAAAFELFRRAGVGIAVVEVGLGGRLDATNVLSPLVTAIVSIDFDHQAQLGGTLTSIAREKAGIAKPGVPMVLGAVPDEARNAILETCARAGAPVIDADDGETRQRVAALPLALAGAHQAANAAVALRVLDELDAQGVRVGPAAVQQALATVRWPGRLETFTVGGRAVVVDAAHNPAGARALAVYLAETEPSGVTLVFGAMRDKAVAAMLGAVAPAVRELIATTAPSPRAMPAADIAALSNAAGVPTRIIAEPAAALDAALETGRTVVVAGSIFLVGPLRERLARGILR
jgi:dihydrofolate synthase/folylpolyglutamate synthase